MVLLLNLILTVWACAIVSRTFSRMLLFMNIGTRAANLAFILTQPVFIRTRWVNMTKKQFSFLKKNSLFLWKELLKPRFFSRYSYVMHSYKKNSLLFNVIAAIFQNSFSIIIFSYRKGMHDSQSRIFQGS